MRDYIFKRLLFLCSLLVLLICGGMVYSLVSGAVPAFEKFGFFHFISSVEWDPRPGNEQYGALAFITGTIMTSFLALVFCIPFSLPVALFTGEYFRGTRAATIIGSVIDLLARYPFDCIRFVGILYPPTLHGRFTAVGTGVRHIHRSGRISRHDHPLCLFTECRVYLYGSQRIERRGLQPGRYTSGCDPAGDFPGRRFRNIRQLYPGLRKSIGRDDGSHDADRPIPISCLRLSLLPATRWPVSSPTSSEKPTA